MKRLVRELGVLIGLLALLSPYWVDAQTTEQTRLYGTFNVNRQPYNPYDERNRYASGSSHSANTSAANKDTIYWERTREHLRNQYDINTDRYSPNWGSNDRVYDSRTDPRYTSRADSRNPPSYDQSRSGSNYDSRSPSYSRYPSSDSRSPFYDSRNQNYDSKDQFDSKAPSFETGSYQGAGSAPVSSYDRDRGSLTNLEREKLRERERELERQRERERELERERSYYLNSRTRVNTNNPINPVYGQNPRTKLPGMFVLHTFFHSFCSICTRAYVLATGKCFLTLTNSFRLNKKTPRGSTHWRGKDSCYFLSEHPLDPTVKSSRQGFPSLQ